MDTQGKFPRRSQLESWALSLAVLGLLAGVLVSPSSAAESRDASDPVRIGRHLPAPPASEDEDGATGLCDVSPALCEVTLPQCPPLLPGCSVDELVDSDDEGYTSQEAALLDAATTLPSTRALALVPAPPPEGGSVIDGLGDGWTPLPRQTTMDGEVCWGQTHRPHESSTQDNTIAAKATTWCPTPKPFLKVHSRFYLVYGGRLREVDRATDSVQERRGRRWEVRVRLTWPYPDDWDASMALVSQHWVQFNSGNWGYAETSNYNEDGIRCD